MDKNIRNRRMTRTSSNHNGRIQFTLMLTSGILDDTNGDAVVKERESKD